MMDVLILVQDPTLLLLLLLQRVLSPGMNLPGILVILILVVQVLCVSPRKVNLNVNVPQVWFLIQLPSRVVLFLTLVILTPVVLAPCVSPRKENLPASVLKAWFQILLRR